MDELYDVVVIGGGPAGLNGALQLARSRRRVAVVDDGEPRNGPADAVHGFFTRDGTPPAELLAIGRAEVQRYGAEVVEGSVVAVAGAAGSFTVTLADGRLLGARRLLVTTGLVDELPEVAGVRERWGREVIHCPYCHGWEVRDQAIGVLATGPMASHQALLFRQLSDDVVVFAHEAPPAAEQAVQLAAMGIRVVEGAVAALEDRAGGGVSVRLASGEVVGCDVVVVGGQMVARSALLEMLGVEVVEQSPAGSRVGVDATGRTSVPGVWAAGNVVDLAAQVVTAAAGGAWAGAQINMDLVMEEVAAAVAAAGSVSEPDTR